ncbi:CCA tRNA nucleotidyltransferase [Haploplasma modicum]|jgi:tRNA nucleotidyltransferase (CCA-adding enzyme)|uniref:CCA tRNA nucleotidyltransferase n=1 Tax=Haploplasma modicum TaxID=2150 RepID=UPI00047CC454|nr:CCA tRNA nucleotidyltransferase [Haploplasma modicum]
MSNIKDARIILRILAENGFEGYIVGGAVRDYLLRIDFNDIDITTNAHPKDVLKIFKGKETGEKYGTVTITFKDQEYQVTTYRSEDKYLDHRHPEEVKFEETVIKDLMRRDFSMNALIMDSTGLIIDHVDGKKDIKNKYVKAIGNPDQRFNEDALRMLRAFYFVSKLGFDIDYETLEAIKKNKDLILKVSSERVLDELIKILQGNHLKKALELMVKSEIHEVLPGLKHGITFFSKSSEMPLVDAFFITSFYLNGAIVPSYYKFPNKHKHKYQTVVKMLKDNVGHTPKDLYEYGLEFSQALNRVNFILGRDTLKALDLVSLFNDLPINSSQDLKLRGFDILKLTDKKQGAWLNNLINEMVILVLDKKLKNNKEDLTKFVLENIERF